MASRCAGLSWGAAAASRFDMLPGSAIDIVARPPADGGNGAPPAACAAAS